MNTPNLEDYLSAGLVSNDQLVELRTRINETLKAHPNLNLVEILSEFMNQKDYISQRILANKK